MDEQNIKRLIQELLNAHNKTAEAIGELIEAVNGSKFNIRMLGIAAETAILAKDKAVEEMIKANNAALEILNKELGEK